MEEPQTQDVMTIFQGWLDKSARAMFDLDMDACFECVSLPFCSSAGSKSTLIESRAEMEEAIRLFIENIKGQGANQYIRLASDAEYLSPDYIEGHYIVHALRNATPVLPSYASRVVLRRSDAGWLLVEMSSENNSGIWPMLGLRFQSTPSIRKSPEHDARRNAMDPLTIYRDVVSRLSNATRMQDFDAFCALCRFPFAAHSYDHDSIRRSPEDARPYFTLFAKQLHDLGVDDITWSDLQAEFIRTDGLCGYHLTRFLSGGKEVASPMKNRLILRREGTRWQIECLTLSLTGPMDARLKDITITDELVTQKELQERAPSWPMSK